MPTYRIADLVTLTTSITGIVPRDILGKDRCRMFARARFAIFTVAREFGHSYPYIGRNVGGRDHSTVISGCEKAQILIEREPEFAAMVDRLRQAALASDPFIEREPARGHVILSGVKMPVLVERPRPKLPALPRQRKPLFDGPIDGRDGASVEFFAGIRDGSAILLAAINGARAEMMGEGLAE